MEVRKAVRAVESGIKQVEAARANVVLQQKKLEAEEKKFENGMTTSFEVLVALDRAKGTLLESKNLSLAM